MEPLYFWTNLYVGLLTLSVTLSFTFPPTGPVPYFQPQRPLGAAVQEPQKAPAVEAERLNTVRVTCHPDSLEIIIQADMFGVGAPVNAYELRLGVEDHDYCRATVSSGDEYRIVVGLMDCGTKHWVNIANSRQKTVVLLFLTCFLCTDG